MKRITPAAILLLLGASLFAGDSPVSYNAITDLVPRPEPPLPALGPAGTKIIDPTFKTTILRVTDPNTNPEAIGGGFLTPAGSFEVNWNADTTMFWVWTVGGFMMPFRFDAANFTATPVRDLRDPSRILTLPYTGTFSFHRPNIMYATSGRTVLEYDFNTQTSTTVFDANAAVPSASGAAYTPSASDDDSKICLAFGGQQDTHPYVSVLDRNTGHYQVLDTVNSLLNGQPANKTLAFGIHSAYIDRTGRFVIMAKGQGKVPGQSEWTVWDVQAGRVYDIEAEWSGHDAAGFGVRVNQSGFYGGDPAFYEEQEWATRGLGESQINNYQYLIPWQDLPTPHQYIYSGHHSWNNARPDALVPVVGSIVRDSTQTSLPWRIYDNEIIAIATDGSGKVYRFAHHRSVWDRSDFWDDPHGNISQDGRWYVFTSNWGRTVGAGRHDIFIVQLPVAADSGTQPPPAPPPVEPPADTTPPSVSITSPASGSLLTSPVTVTVAASDDRGVAGVQLLVNGVAASAEDTLAPYEFAWTAAEGVYALAARARDTAGNVSTSPTVSVTVAVAPPPVQPPPDNSSNLLVNPGFEEGTAGWAFFDHERRWVESDPVHSGSNAAKIGIASSFYSNLEQIVPVQAGAVYTAGAWMALDQIGGSRGAGIVLFWLDASGAEIGETWVSPLLGTVPWTCIQQNVTAPAGAVRVKFELWCFTDPDDSGSAYFDDAWFGPVAARPARLVRTLPGVAR